MSKSIELSDQDYARIQRAADAAGMPVDAWIVENLPLNGNGKVRETPLLDCEGNPAKTVQEDLPSGRAGVIVSGGATPAGLPVPPAAKPARTMADRLAGRVGVFESKGDGRLSQNTGERFTDYLEEKRRAGHL